MKDAEVCIFKNIENMKYLVGYINVKEQFIRNSFRDEAFILVALSEDSTFRKEILFNKIKDKLLRQKSYPITEFTVQYGKEISQIYQYKNKYHESLSWLEIFNIAVFLKEDSPTDCESLIRDTIKKISEFNKILEKKY